MITTRTNDNETNGPEWGEMWEQPAQTVGQLVAAEMVAGYEPSPAGCVAFFMGGELLELCAGDTLAPGRMADAGAPECRAVVTFWRRTDRAANGWGSDWQYVKLSYDGGPEQMLTAGYVLDLVHNGVLRVIAGKRGTSG